MLTPMVVSSVVVDSLTNSPIVVLKEIGGKETLLIWIGLLEANAIASELEGAKLSRPMTHDLLKNLLDLTDVKVRKVEVCDLRENTYFARIHFRHREKDMWIDARPSDALALSLRINTPIFVDDKVIKKSKHMELQVEAEDKSEQGKKWQKVLENLDPEDFGNS